MSRALLALLLTLTSQDKDADALFAQLESPEASVRTEAFQKLAASSDSKTTARLRKALAGLLELWSKKAASERSRAQNDLIAARKKSFNAQAFANKQKEALKLLTPENLDRMEPLVRELMETFYINPLRSEEDEKVADSIGRAQELARFVDELENQGKPVMEDRIRGAYRAMDEAVQIQLMPEKDQKVMRDNVALRTKLSEEEGRAIFITNQYRVLMGKNALRINLNLCAAARDHSKDMKEKDFFDHESPVPGKRTPVDRAKRFGAKALGENIYMGPTTGPDAFWGWFRSLPHHQGMLERCVEIGIGEHHTYWTELFGEP